MARMLTAVGSLVLSDGERQTRTGNLRAVEPVPTSSQAVAKGNLYVLVELGGEQPASARLYRLILNTIQGVYYDAAGGIAGGITEAILAAHQALEQHNSLNPENSQLGGVSCVALRGEELYVGIGGPAMALVGHPGRVEQFPGELSSDITPLGGAEAPAIELFRTSVEQDTLVVQVQSEWVARVPPRKLAAAALADEMEAAQEYLEALAPPQASLSALLVRISAPPDLGSEARGEQAELETAEASQEPVPTATTADDQETAETEAAGEVAPDGVIPAVAPGTETAVTSQEAEIAARGPRRWLWLLVLVPLIAVVAIAAVWWWQQRTVQIEFATLIQGAEAALQAATAEGVPEEVARAQLSDAEERTDAALNLRPGDPQASELREKILLAQDEVNRVTPLYKLITLQPIGGAGSEPARVVVQGTRVYVLDRGLDRVLRYNLNEISGLIPQAGEDVVAQRGQTLPDGQVIGELVDIAWVPAGGQRRSSNLLILDSNRNLIEVDDALGLRPVSVASREQWQLPGVIAGYNGNFYLLDRGLGRILRYRPDDNGQYDNPPENYFENDVSLDLSRAIDMGIDGNIWILYADGTVQTFFQGRQQAFEMELPPNGAITQPQAIFAGSEAGEAQSLYIADSGMGRILEYSKEGDYLRQFRPADTADQEKIRKMRALNVDEIERTFYILTTEALFRTDIP